MARYVDTGFDIARNVTWLNILFSFIPAQRMF